MMKYKKWIVAVILGFAVSHSSLASLKPQWDAKAKTISFYPTDFPIKLVTAVSGEKIYLATPKGTVSARHAKTGKVIWSQKTNLKLK